MTYQPVPIKNLLHVSAIPTLLYYSYTPDFISKWDEHDFWELIYVDHGVTIICAEDRTFPLHSGQAILHRPNVRHQECGLQVLLLAFLHIRHRLLQGSRRIAHRRHLKCV